MKVLAVVVTHNRARLLGRCIDHLLRQERAADGILVIDNGSTDGTAAMLRQRKVDFVAQENVGSAGGWHRGIGAALERGYDAVWLMDDDGYPDPWALDKLHAVLEQGVACASSVVVCEEQPSRFVFPFPVLDDQGLPVLFRFPRKIRTLAELEEWTKGEPYPFAHFFNGALISLAAVRNVGNVDRDFFIFGDEVDYFFRLRAVGNVVSVLKAIHYHPDVGQRPYSPTKVYYYVKNTLTLHQRYFNHVWIRNGLSICAALVRTFRRNGALTALSYIAGPNASVLRKAIRRGLQGRVAKDIHE